MLYFAIFMIVSLMVYAYTFKNDFAEEDLAKSTILLSAGLLIIIVFRMVGGK